MPISHKVIPKRIIIYAKDIQNITGRSERSARALLQRIKMYCNKQKGQCITVSDFCTYMGLRIEDIDKFLI